MNGPFKSVEDFRRWADELDHPNCPVAIRTRELQEERERETRKAREEREAERQHDEQQAAAARNSADWYAWVDERITQHFLQYFRRDAEGNIGPMTAAIGEAIGHNRAETRKEFQAAIDKLREEFKATTNKLHDELDRRRVVDQERRELERTLSQSHLDAANARIAGAIETAIAELRSEFDVAGVAEEVHNELRRRLPVVEPWKPERVFYRGDLVTHNGSTYQAYKDTGQPPDHQDWACIARAGADGVDGRTPCLRGVFNAYERYQHFDIVTCDGNCYIACRDHPGLPGHADGAWQLLARGSRGPEGAVGPRGRKGERGARGEDATPRFRRCLTEQRERRSNSGACSNSFCTRRKDGPRNRPKRMPDTSVALCGLRRTFQRLLGPRYLLLYGGHLPLKRSLYLFELR